MEYKLLFYQAASALPEGRSLSDYEWAFYRDNAGKGILTAQLTDVSDGQVLAYDDASGEWVNTDQTGGSTVTVGTTQPSNPATGDMWFDTTDDSLYVYDGSAFVENLGEPGLSAYEVAVSEGFVGTEEQWLESLIGPTGPKGDTGDTGPVGPEGPTGVIAAEAPITYDAETQTVGFDGTAVGSLTDVDYISFDQTAAHDPELGEIAWDADFDTLVVGINGINLQVGQEHIVRVKNASGTTAINKGKVVMFAGATGDTVSVNPAVSDGSVNNEYLVGITAEQIPADGFGFVTQFGFITNIKTDYAGWGLGSLLYADPATPGGLTITEPTAPAWHKPIAAVTRVNANSGRILVRADTGDRLNELHDVATTSVADGDFLIYDGTKWTNESTVTWGQLAGS